MSGRHTVRGRSSTDSPSPTIPARSSRTSRSNKQPIIHTRPLVDDIALRAGRGDEVASIAEAVGLSTRQLQRRCADAFGYGAKTLVRILRMTRALELARAGTTLADTAASAGYADQAHLSRDVKQLAGVPLGQLVVPAGSAAYRSTELPSGS